MAKRNQFNRPDLDHISELTVNTLQVSGSIRTSGSVFVQSATNPEISLKKSNPGARMRYRIIEETINFAGSNVTSASGSQNNRMFLNNRANTPASKAAETGYSGSLAIPVNSYISAIGVYIGTSFSGSNYIKRIGITSSAGTPNSNTGIARNNKEVVYANRDYFYGPNAIGPSGHGHASGPELHFAAIGPTAGSSSVYFPSMGRITGSTRANETPGLGGIAATQGAYYYTGFTGSNAVISFELNEASNLTGSITYSIFLTQYSPPTSA